MNALQEAITHALSVACCDANNLKCRAEHDQLAAWLEELQRLRADLVPQAAPVPEWQGIETAPKDGTRVLLCSKERVHEGWFASWNNFPTREFISGWATNWNSEFCLPDQTIEPTHWMPLPLPAAPTLEKK